MNTGELYTCLPELAGREIQKICYCERKDGAGMAANLYLEFADGSHFEIYADAELRFTGLKQFDPAIGSIVDRAFTQAKKEGKAAKVNRIGCVLIEYGSLLK